MFTISSNIYYQNLFEMLTVGEVNFGWGAEGGLHSAFKGRLHSLLFSECFLSNHVYLFRGCFCDVLVRALPSHWRSLYFDSVLGIAVEALPYRTYTDLLNNLPKLWQIKPLFCTFCGYCDIPVAWSHYLFEPDLLNNIPQLRNMHFLWLLWTYQSPEATISPYPTC